MSGFTPRHPRPRSTLGPLMLQALGAAGAMITDEYIWSPFDAPVGRRDGMSSRVLGYDLSMPEVGPIAIHEPIRVDIG